MNISLIIKKHAKDGREFYGATARGKYLKGVKGVGEADAETMYVVKIVNGCGAFPAAEGVYDCGIEGDAWIDSREGVECCGLKVVRIKGVCTFNKKADLKPF